MELFEKSEYCGQSENSAERLLKNEIKDLEMHVNYMESDIISIKDELKNAIYKVCNNWCDISMVCCKPLE